MPAFFISVLGALRDTNATNTRPSVEPQTTRYGKKKMRSSFYGGFILFLRESENRLWSKPKEKKKKMKLSANG